jgi:hypothetical protein
MAAVDQAGSLPKRGMRGLPANKRRDQPHREKPRKTQADVVFAGTRWGKRRFDRLGTENATNGVLESR